MHIRRVPARNVVRPAAYALALAGSLGPGACGDATAPLPPGAERFAPPPVYARWWALTEACAGLTGHFARYTWYVAPGSSVPVGRTGDAAAYTDVAARRVVLATSVREIGSYIRHEMLHALLGPAYATGDVAHQHPPAYFQGRCAGVVACPDEGCRDAGPAPVTAPADAPTLPLSSLRVQVEASPNPVSRTGGDTALTLVVRVTNPSAGPVWVPLEQSPDLPAPWVHWYGFRVVPAGQPVPVSDLARSDVASIVTSDTVSRVPFAAGQTRQLVFDVAGA